MLDQKFLNELQQYVEHYLNFVSMEVFQEAEYKDREIFETIQGYELEDFIKTNRKPSFHHMLFHLIDHKGMSDTAIYKKAGIDRRHFSKIRSNPDYRPRKNTVIALTFALELNKKETDKLLNSAGYSLSESETFDLVIRFCLEKKMYNLFLVNEALDYFGLKPIV
ncbi:hypothetical protein [Neobacillus fumarioli]|uniref:hypothetical protein n=1 Tax=Neobacillus fumarioli TaxID=105229 RepID=UPI0008317CF6|nr:hypothetical protein [Neobacillus fumarioli]